jgi:hypothetical protein
MDNGGVGLAFPAGLIAAAVLAPADRVWLSLVLSPWTMESYPLVVTE